MAISFCSNYTKTFISRANLLIADLIDFLIQLNLSFNHKSNAIESSESNAI